MPSKLGTSFTPQAPQRKYDFHDLGGHDVADGNVWRLDKGRDYACSEASLRQHARRFASEHGLHFDFVRIRAERGVTGVEIAFAPDGSPLPTRAGRERRGRTPGEVGEA